MHFTLLCRCAVWLYEACESKATEQNLSIWLWPNSVNIRLEKYCRKVWIWICIALIIYSRHQVVFLRAWIEPRYSFLRVIDATCFKCSPDYSSWRSGVMLKLKCSGMTENRSADQTYLELTFLVSCVDMYRSYQEADASQSGLSFTLVSDQLLSVGSCVTSHSEIGARVLLPLFQVQVDSFLSLLSNYHREQKRLCSRCWHKKWWLWCVTAGNHVCLDSNNNRGL